MIIDMMIFVQCDSKKNMTQCDNMKEYKLVKSVELRSQ